MMGDSKLLVAAIDFGSYGAGCAFSFDYQYKLNPLHIQTTVWRHSGSRDMTKVPFVLLFDQNKHLHSFGYDAEDKFEDLVNEGQNDNWYYFRGFKMQLYLAVESGVDVRDDFKLKDLGGKVMSAKVVFSKAIAHMKDNLLKEMTERNLNEFEDMVHYVITVPAIWNDNSKQFMRESAEKAGISSDKLSMVYEPEAAAIHAIHLPVEKFIQSEDSVSLERFQPGRKFIVLDAGGGTIDISTQEVSKNQELKIIHKVRGGPWGGEFTNKNFLNVIANVVGNELMIKFRKSHSRDFLQIIRDFETKKRAFRGKEGNKIRITLPLTFLELENNDGKNLQEMILVSEYKTDISLKRDKLVIEQDLFKKLFTVQIEMIITEMRSILQHEACESVSAIMMVGGFSESEIVQDAIHKEFRGMGIDIFIPMDGALSVLKGAVIYGHNSNIVTSRLCPFTFGVDVCVPFDPKLHPLEKLIYSDGRKVCCDVFSILFVSEEVVEVGNKKSIDVFKTYFTRQMQSYKNTNIEIDFYVSTSKHPSFVSDDNCHLHANLIVPSPVGGWPEIVIGEIELEIAGTEMIGTFIEKETLRRSSVRFEFLPSIQPGAVKQRLFDPFEI